MLLAALLQAAPVTAQGLLSGLLAGFLSPAGLASTCIVVLTLVGLIWAKDARRKAQVAAAVGLGFHIVEDLKDQFEVKNQALDKVGTALKSANDWLMANGWAPMSETERDASKLGLSAIHGATKVAANIAEASALTFVKESIPAPTPNARPPR